MNVVVVESPTKASTIGRYLGPDFTVVASYGHVRDLLPKDGSVRPDDAFAMDWTVSDGAEKHIGAIGRALRGARTLYLATDPDREGEAISWHVRDELGRRGLLDGVAVQRVVFSEVTKSAVLDAMADPRELDDNLIDAYKARRALDYLVGFTLSPVLWRKLPGSRSAGRVQSVALRLICAREVEIEAFKPREYWSIEVDLDTPRGERVVARLASLEGEKLGKYGLGDRAAAERAAALVREGRYHVASVETKRVKRNPAPPFTTSTLQQEASRKLGFAARRTMQVAQQLYEGIAVGGEQVGLITYMRTDGVQIAEQALSQARDVIGRRYGANYVPEKPRRYRTRAKNAQEAHEAIRPTDLGREPRSLAGALNKDQARLYELIWKRALASQMASAEIDRVGVDIASDDGRVGLRATGATIAFDGFLRVYQEGRDDARRDNGDDADDERTLPTVKEGEPMAVEEVKPAQHFTEPPPRYSEASLVRRLEELGIGRPSTYASIISVLQDRSYVRLEKRRFVPEDRGRIVTVFLESFFSRYVEYDFTASLEGQLDTISAGEIDWRAVLSDFWRDFAGAVEETKGLRVKQVLDALDETLGRHLFPAEEGGEDRRCPKCADGRLGLKLGRYGPFVGCSNYPECRFTRPLADGGDEAAEPRTLGNDPETGLPVALKRGPYGLYVERGVAAGAEEKPKRVSLPQDLAPDMVDLETAVGLLGLPREVGAHPETGKPITAGIGRFGAYVKHDGAYRSLPRGDNVLTVGLNRAVVLIAEKKGGTKLLRELGAHPESGEAVTLHTGRYGPYVQHRRLRASLPKGTSDDELTLEQAVTLLAAKAKKDGAKKSAGGRRKPAAAKAGGARRKTKRAPSRQPDAPAGGAP
ncbi:MAG: type I DNA topoisomerase [Rhodospirillales bacterium]|nr:type I DNA topoisomerase [Rhodospirillales bacterium]MDE0379811.1 type I DNA topoisomerase [Rhodospirillales bacterium]